MPKDEYTEALRHVNFYRFFVHFLVPIVVVMSLFTCVFCVCQPMCWQCFGCNKDKRRTRTSTTNRNETHYSPTPQWESTSCGSVQSGPHLQQSRNSYQYQNAHCRQQTAVQQRMNREEEVRLLTLGETAHLHRSFPISTAAVVVNGNDNTRYDQCESNTKSSPMNPDHRPVIYI